MREIVVVATRPKAFFKPFSWAIRAIERTPYSHVAIKTFSETCESWIIYQASGVQVNFVGEKHFHDTVHIVHEFRFKISDEAYRQYLRFAVKNAGEPYGMKPVLGIPLVRMFNLKSNPLADGRKAWYCAELVLHVLKDFLEVHVTEEEFETAGPRKIVAICERLRDKFNEVLDQG